MVWALLVGGDQVRVVNYTGDGWEVSSGEDWDGQHWIDWVPADAIAEIWVS